MVKQAEELEDIMTWVRQSSNMRLMVLSAPKQERQVTPLKALQPILDHELRLS